MKESDWIIDPGLIVLEKKYAKKKLPEYFQRLLEMSATKFEGREKLLFTIGFHYCFNAMKELPAYLQIPENERDAAWEQIK